MRTCEGFGVFSLVLSFCGCASFSVLKTPRAIDPGSSQLTAAVGIVGIPVAAAGSTGNAPQYAAQVELAGRLGIMDGFDLGAKVWTEGAEVNATLSLVRSRSFDLAIAPALGVQRELGVLGYQISCPGGGCGPQPDGLQLFAQLPVLAGISLGFGHELVFGPEVVVVQALDQSAVVDDLPRTGLLVGGLLGVSFKLAGRLRVMPELTVLVPATNFYTPQLAAIDGYGQTGSVFVQGAVSFSYGNDGSRDR